MEPEQQAAALAEVYQRVHTLEGVVQAQAQHLEQQQTELANAAAHAQHVAAQAAAAAVAAAAPPAPAAVEADPPAAAADGGDRSLPIKPDRFNGDTRTDVRSWLFQVDTYFEAAGTPEARRVPIAAALLHGAALSWWRNHKEAKTAPTTWEAFKTNVSETFEIINSAKTARDRLARLRQTSSVRAYATAFRNVSLDIPGITEDERKDRFLRGLNVNVQREVEIRAPATFEEMVRAAERFDAVTYNLRRSGPNEHKSGAWRDLPRPAAYHNAGPMPMELGTMQHQRRGANSNNERRVSMSPELRIKLIRDGKCLYCHQPGHVALNCPEKQKQTRFPNGGRR